MFYHKTTKNEATEIWSEDKKLNISQFIHQAKTTKRRTAAWRSRSCWTVLRAPRTTTITGRRASCWTSWTGCSSCGCRVAAGWCPEWRCCSTPAPCSSSTRSVTGEARRPSGPGSRPSATSGTAPTPPTPSPTSPSSTSTKRWRAASGWPCS